MAIFLKISLRFVAYAMSPLTVDEENPLQEFYALSNFRNVKHEVRMAFFGMI